MGRDGASKGSLTWLERGLQSLGASFRHVSMIVVTHYHSNHVGGLARLHQPRWPSIKKKGISWMAVNHIRTHSQTLF